MKINENKILPTSDYFMLKCNPDYIEKQAECFLGFTLFRRPGRQFKPKKKQGLKYQTRVKKVLKNYDTTRLAVLHFLIIETLHDFFGVVIIKSMQNKYNCQ